MADMSKIVGAVVAITVSVIIVASVLAPTIAEYTESGAALAEYSGLLSSIIVLTVVGVLMIAVKLISGRQ